MIRQVNLLVATGQNNLAMNRTVAQIARHYITGPDIPEALRSTVSSTASAATTPA